MKTWTTKSGYKITKILSGRSNVFLLSNGDKKILIDTSPAKNWKKLNNRLKSQKISHIDFLVLTHTHYDHAGNSFQLKKNYGAHVIVHLEEEYYIRNGKNKFPAGTNPLTRFLVRKIGAKISDKFNYEPCPPDIVTDVVFSFEKIGFNAWILPTPGHSPGSVSLIVDDEIAIVGDAIFGVFENSIFPPFADDIDVMIESWGKLLDTGCKLFLPAHGFAKTEEKVRRDFLRRTKPD